MPETKKFNSTEFSPFNFSEFFAEAIKFGVGFVNEFTKVYDIQWGMAVCMLDQNQWVATTAARGVNQNADAFGSPAPAGQPGGTAVENANHNQSKEAVAEYYKQEGEILAAIMDKIPAQYLAGLGTRIGTMNLLIGVTIVQLFAHLKDISAVHIPEIIEHNLAAMAESTDIKTLELFTAFVNKVQRAERALAAAEYPLSDNEVVRLVLTKAIAKDPSLREGKKQFLDKYPNFATHTTANLWRVLRAALATHVAMNPDEENLAMAVQKSTSESETIKALKAEIAQYKAGTVFAKGGKKPIHYCWSHGTMSNHTSGECNKQKNKDHEVTATAGNKLGGNPANFRTERAAYNAWIIAHP